MNNFKKCLSYTPEFIASIAFITMIVVVVLNVLLRYFFQKSLVWCEEIAALGFIWTIFMGAAVCYKNRDLISVDMLISALPLGIKRYAYIIIDVFMICASVIICVLSLKFALSAWSKTSLALKIPYTFFDIPATIAFAYMSYYSVKHLITDIKKNNDMVREGV